MPKFQQIAANIDLASGLLARLDAIEAGAADLQSQITMLNGQVSTLNGQVSAINTTLGSLQAQINTINSRLAAAGIP